MYVWGDFMSYNQVTTLKPWLVQKKKGVVANGFGICLFCICE